MGSWDGYFKMDECIYLEDKIQNDDIRKGFGVAYIEHIMRELLTLFWSCAAKFHKLKKWKVGTLRSFEEQYVV